MSLDYDDEFEQYDFSEFTADDLAAIDADMARLHGGLAIRIAIQDSPFTKFRAWRGHLAVTDLVAPSWCEVQYEYNLYGRNYMPLSQRPSSFTSKNGKQIVVDRHVAHANDRTLRRGKSVHKLLENELRPIKVVIRPATDEERFGLRLVQLIDGFTQLVTDGITRELPVFLFTHNQVVVGVIDEVRRTPLNQVTQNQVVPSRSPPGTPSASPPRKQRRLSSSAHQQLTYGDSNLLPETPVLNLDPNPEPISDPTHADLGCLSPYPYELHIRDYKTRRAPNIPLDQDSLSPRLQLMMYHRMLSSLLKPEEFDFNLLWTKLNLDPTRSFSASFAKDIGWEQRQMDPTDSNLHLDRLVSEWTSTVQRQRFALLRVNQQLELVYRHSVGKRRGKGKHPPIVVDRDDLLEALVLQEELELAHAIEESLHGMGYQQAAEVAGQVAQTVMQTGPLSLGHTSAIWKDLISPIDSDPALTWAIQQSLLTCARQARGKVPAPDDAHGTDTQHGASSLDGDEQLQKQSPIIGTKQFTMNDEELDRHLLDVLQWWLGARPARGVDISQTYRCFTCEYQDSCEWREQKGKAAAKSEG